MDSRNRNIFTDPHIDLFFSTDIDSFPAFKCDELEKFAFFLFPFLFHDLQHKVRFFWLRYIDCVVLYVVEVNSVFVFCSAHLAAERLPVYCNAERSDDWIQLLGQPRFKAS